jgi:micrococcal nuclease
MFQYAANVLRVIDGDTIDVDLDLGFRVRFETQLRLKGLNTPETRGPTREAGLRSKAYVEQALPVGALIIVHTFKVEKYGRYLARVIYAPGAKTRDEILANPHDLNRELLDRGLAVPFMVND